jgi:hypothetical protein
MNKQHTQRRGTYEVVKGSWSSIRRKLITYAIYAVLTCANKLPAKVVFLIQLDCPLACFLDLCTQAFKRSHDPHCAHVAAHMCSYFGLKCIKSFRQLIAIIERIPLSVCNVRQTPGAIHKKHLWECVQTVKGASHWHKTTIRP